MQLVTFHTFNLYFIYLIHFILIFSMQVLAIAFRFIVLRCWNCNWRKEIAAYSIFGYDYRTAESASSINFDFDFAWCRFCLSYFVFDFRSGLGGSSLIGAKSISGRIKFSI